MKTRLAARLSALVLVGAMATAACGSSKNDNKSSSPTTAGSTSGNINYGALSATLNGSGSSFQLPLQEAARAAFQSVASKVTINYPGGGSGKGKTDLQAGDGTVVNFAGTDSLPKPEEKALYKGGDLLYFPIAAAPITVSYQLKGVTKLSLSPDTVAKIFQAQITSWNDKAIADDNPGVTLPNTKIFVAHRSDGSGTTSNFTKFLLKAAPTTWTLGQGDTVNWPASTQGGNGNLGVAQLIGNGTGTLKGTDGAIGYVDFSDAKASGLKFASIKNSAGNFVAPSLAGVSAALAETTPAADLSYDPINAAGATTYPIATPTWVIIYKNQTDKAKGAALRGYLNFLLTDGQSLNESVNYAKLPANYLTKAKAQLDKIVIPA